MKLIADKYEVIREVGVGATGTVYLVKHKDLGVEYALKILNRFLSNDQKFISRFKKEGEVLTRFTHPGSVQLRDFGKTDDGLYYMTMEFCEGTVLKDALEERGQFSVKDSLEIVRQTLDVLDAAHKAGIIHRDIKPDNIMLVEKNDGSFQVKIMDFGIAKIRQEVDLSTTMTIEGATVGTPQYMSPEQAGGESNLDHRVDVYSAGIVLYELLSGTLPIKGETVLQTMIMQLTKPPNPFNEDLNIPNAVQEVVFKALAKSKSGRFDNAAEFSTACLALIEKINKGESLGETSRAVKQSGLAEQFSEESNQGKKILHLDDDEMILHITKHILEREGYQVHSTSDPALIHNHVFSQHVDLMICDVQMPAMPGTTVCKLLKKAKPDLKIVLFSNIGERELAKLVVECNVNAWMSKNDKPDAWLLKVKELLGS
ncbi:MAG: protein kinase [Bdellovibrionota bacterium]